MTTWEIVEEALARKHKSYTWLAEQLSAIDKRITDQAVNHWKERGVPKARLRPLSTILSLSIDQLEGFAQLPWERPIEWPFEDVPRDRYFNLAPGDRKRVQAEFLESIAKIENENLQLLGRAGIRRAPASIGTTPAPSKSPAKPAKRPRR